MNNCPHEHTIDVGDTDHMVIACLDCKKILGSPYVDDHDCHRYPNDGCEICEQEAIRDHKNVNGIEHCPSCGHGLVVTSEYRGAGFWEHVGYCDYCGLTETL